MRLSALNGMEVINLWDGSRIGFIVGADAMLDAPRGRLTDLYLVVRRGWWGRRFHIPWSAVRVVGADLLIVEIPVGGKTL